MFSCVETYTTVHAGLTPNYFDFTDWNRSQWSIFNILTILRFLNETMTKWISKCWASKKKVKFQKHIYLDSKIRNSVNWRITYTGCKTNTEQSVGMGGKWAQPTSAGIFQVPRKPTMKIGRPFNILSICKSIDTTTLTWKLRYY